MDRFKAWLTLIVCGVLALAMGGVGLKLVADGVTVSGWPEGQGKVTSIEETISRGRRGRETVNHFPIFEIKTQDGATHSARNKVSVDADDFPIGKTVKVKYSPDGRTAWAEGSGSPYTRSLLMLGLALVLGLVAVFTGMRLKKESAENPDTPVAR